MSNATASSNTATGHSGHAGFTIATSATTIAIITSMLNAVKVTTKPKPALPIIG